MLTFAKIRKLVKLIKKIVGIVGWLLALMLTAVATLMIVFSLPGFQRRATEALTEVLQAATGLPVSIGKLRYAPFATFELQHIEIADDDSLPMLSLRRVTAELAFASLWNRRLEINTVLCDSLVLLARELPGGGYNLSALGATDSTALDTTETEPFGLRIGTFLASNCNAHLYRQRGDTLSLTGMAVDVRNLTNGPEGMQVDVHSLALDLEAVGAPRRVGFAGLLALHGDTLGVRDAMLTLGRSLARVEHLTLRSDTGGVAWAQCNIPILHVSSELLTAAAGFPLPGLHGWIEMTLDSTRLRLNRLRLAMGRESFVSLEGSVARQWRTQPSEVHIVEARTNGNDINTILGNSLSRAQASSIGRVSLSGSARLNEQEAAVTLSARADQGALDLRASASTANAWQRAALKGTLNAQARLGELTGGSIGKATVNLDANGLLDTQGEGTYIMLSGNVPGLEALGHTWRDIDLSGVLENKKANGLIDIRDPWCQALLVFEGDRNGAAPYRSLALRLDRLRLDALGALPDRNEANVACRTRVELVGEDALSGELALNVANVDFTDTQDTVHINKLRMDSWRDDVGQRIVEVQGDLLQGRLRGEFTLDELQKELLYQAHLASPALLPTAPAPASPPETEVDLRVLRLRDVAKIVAPELSLSDTLTLRGRIEGAEHSAWLNVALGEAAQGSLRAEKLTAAVLSLDGDLSVGVECGQLTAPVLGSVADFNLAAELTQDRASADALWAGNGGKETRDKKKEKRGDGDVTADGYIYDEGGGQLNLEAAFSRAAEGGLVTDLSIDRTRLCLLEQPWTLDSCRMRLAPNVIDVGRFKLANNIDKRQFILARGRASESLDDTITLALNKIVLEQLLPTNEESAYQLSGDLYSQVDIRGLLGGRIAEGYASIRRFHVCNDNLERLDLAAAMRSDTIDLGLDIITGGAVRGHADGYIDLNNAYLDLPFLLDSLSTGFLNFYLDSSVDSWKGSTTGDLHLYGPLSDLKLYANLGMNHDNWFRVKQTNVFYHIDRQDSVILTPSLIGFKDIRFSDRYGHRCLFSGGIDHDMYSGLVYHIRFDIDRALVLETTPQESPTYYGTVFGTGFMSVRGTTSDVKININARTDKGSKFCVVPSARGDIGEQTYITFQKRGSQQESVYERLDRIGSVTSSLSLDVTPDAELAIVLNPATGNQLTGRGEGAVRVAIDNDGELSMFGQYNITSGLYNFSFENVINKKFDIKPGSTVSWNGDPYNANLDVVASYKLKASLYDLVAGSGEQVSPDLKRRVPINCNILLTNKLMDPDIAFDIEIPSSQNFNQYTFEQYVNTPDEMNRQVFSLLLSGKFYNSQSQQNILYDSPAMLSQTATEMLSNQLSNLISQNKANLGVGVSYRPGDEIQNEEYELSLSTSVLNDKILLSGNVGYGRDTKATAESNGGGQFIGDFDLEVKINRPGTLRAKAYTHSNNDVVYETSPTTQGVGLSFQEEFDSFRGLAMRYKEMLQRRRALRQLKKSLKLKENANEANPDNKETNNSDKQTPAPPEKE